MADFNLLSATMERERAKKAKARKRKETKVSPQKKNRLRPEDEYALLEAGRLKELARLARNPAAAPRLIRRSVPQDPEEVQLQLRRKERKGSTDMKDKRHSVADNIMQTEARTVILEKVVPSDKWGISLADDKGDGRGLYVTEVTGGVAENRMESGDRIYTINGFKVGGKTVRDAAPAIRGQRKLTLVVYGVPGFAGRHTAMVRGTNGHKEKVHKVSGIMATRTNMFDTGGGEEDDDIPAHLRAKQKAQKKELSAGVAAALRHAAELNQEETYQSLGPRTVEMSGAIADRLGKLAAMDESAQHQAATAPAQRRQLTGKIAEAQEALRAAEAAKVGKVQVEIVANAGMKEKMEALRLKEKAAALDLEKEKEFQRTTALKVWGHQNQGGANDPNFTPEIVKAGEEVYEAPIEVGGLKDRIAALQAEKERKIAAQGEIDYAAGGSLADRLAAFGAGEAEEEDDGGADLDWMMTAFGGEGMDGSAMAEAFGVAEGGIAIPKKGAPKKKAVSSLVANAQKQSESAIAEANAVVDKNDLESPFKKELSGTIAAQLQSLQALEADANAKVELQASPMKLEAKGAIAERINGLKQAEEEFNSKPELDRGSSLKRSLSSKLRDQMGALGAEFVEPAPDYSNETPKEKKQREKKQKEEEKKRLKAEKEAAKAAAKAEKEAAKAKKK